MEEYQQAYQEQAYQDNTNATTQDDEYASQIREQRVVTFLTEIDPEKTLESIEMRLKGFFFNKLDQKWIKRDYKNPVPTDLINEIMPLLSSLINMNTTFSNLQVSDVNRIMAELVDVVLSDLVVNGQKYGIHLDFNLKERISLIVFNTVYLTLRRCVNGMEAKRLLSSLRMSETIVPQKKGGLGGLFTPFGR